MKMSVQELPWSGPPSVSPVLLHRHFGAAMPELGWVPAPRYLMRRDLLLRLFDRVAPGRLLEVGCGAGALLADLAARGFQTTGIDRSPAARSLAGALAATTQRMRIAGSIPPDSEGQFDQLAAFEVLEHIEHDHAALADWSRYLRSGGTLFLSVPAHPLRWNAADEWAGHYRRYTRPELTALVEGAGYRITELQSYGFPLANAMERLGAWIYARQSRQAARTAMSKTDRTEASGSDRRLLTRLWPIYGSWLGSLVLRAALAVQRVFVRTDLGIGYIVVARKIR